MGCLSITLMNVIILIIINLEYIQSEHRGRENVKHRNNGQKINLRQGSSHEMQGRQRGKVVRGLEKQVIKERKEIRRLVKANKKFKKVKGQKAKNRKKHGKGGKKVVGKPNSITTTVAYMTSGSTMTSGSSTMTSGSSTVATAASSVTNAATSAAAITNVTAG